VRYRDQQQFLHHSRLWGAAAIAFVLIAAATCLASARPQKLLSVDFGLTALALAFSIQYSPDYLCLSVNAEKKQRWQIKVRWRMIGAGIILGLLSVSGLSSALWLLGAVGWTTAANVLAAKLPRNYSFVYFWITDFILLAALLYSGKLIPMVAIALLAAAAHLSVVICDRRPLLWAGAVGAMSCMLLFLPLWRAKVEVVPGFLQAACAFIIVVVLTTAFLVERAQRQNDRNVEAAMKELVEFTGYPPEKIRQLWSTSNQQLARNWQSAGLDEGKGERLAEWYRENSELYMFAISAYNLEYKRILSNLRILQLARGACLDYGAGNGEILLELARRGHPVSYFDVDGVSMKFARRRAENQDLAVQFFHAKDSLTAWARQCGGFDTVFSFDVLEHLPDLPGELAFLSSLLNRGGLFVFDVPAGTTKAHPMHLNHRLNVRSYMLERGLKEENGVEPRLTFRKEEKYFFRAP
jgi:2-polyprenyl-3-methyl-5-hydroxy-6-metoxy-1,4-benzoquinol methylase